MPRPIFTFTDYGVAGPYLCQLAIEVRKLSPHTCVSHLLADAPRSDPRRAAYLLAALVSHMPADAVVVAVVDPGVGGARLPLMVECDGRVFVGPDNGLLAPLIACSERVEARRIDWRPVTLSRTFHGRDLFAPVAALVSDGQPVATSPLPLGGLVGSDWPAEMAEVIYIDHFGNAFTGLRAETVPPTAVIETNGQRLAFADTFSAVGRHQAFWYGNSCGLLEIAANGCNAAEQLGLVVGTDVQIVATG